MAFYKLSGIMPEKEAIDLLRKDIKKRFGKFGEKVVQ